MQLRFRRYTAATPGLASMPGAAASLTFHQVLPDGQHKDGHWYRKGHEEG